MNKIFIINGGAGKTACSIPGFEKFARLNPENDFIIVAPEPWTHIFDNNNILQERVYPHSQKGIFEQFFKQRQIVYLEPYYSNRFYNNKISLIEAYDEAINSTLEHDDLHKTEFLNVSTFEKNVALEMIQHEMKKRNKKYCVMTQPFGSATTLINGIPYDETSRSMEADDYYNIIHQLKDECFIVNASPQHLASPIDDITYPIDNFLPEFPYVRRLMALTSVCDFFFGCESVGQHFANGLGIPGMVFMGMTPDVPFSYPEKFIIYRAKEQGKYPPWRISETDSKFVAFAADGCMKMSQAQIEESVRIIKSNFYK